MKIIKKGLYTFLGVLLLVVACAHASDVCATSGSMMMVKTDDEFNDMLAQYPLVVAYVYRLFDEQSYAQCGKTCPQESDELDVMAGIADDDRYKRAGVRFVALNAARGGLDFVYTSFGVPQDHSSVILFRKGILY